MLQLRFLKQLSRLIPLSLCVCVCVWLLNLDYVGLHVVMNPLETYTGTRQLPHRSPNLHNKDKLVKTYSPSLTYVTVPFRKPLRKSNFTYIGIRSTALFKKLFQHFSLYFIYKIRKSETVKLEIVYSESHTKHINTMCG